MVVTATYFYDWFAKLVGAALAGLITFFHSSHPVGSTRIFAEGSLFGTFLGGLILGLMQTLAGHFFGAAAQMLFVYLAILLVLAVRPQGLFGR